MSIFTPEWLFWLISLEFLGLAALPITVLCFKSLPDAGYGLARILGLLLLGFINWWLGSSVGLANQPALLWLGLVVMACGGALLLRRAAWRLIATRGRDIARIAVHEEAIFLIAYVAWSLVRAMNPDIHDAEHPMDYMLLQASSSSTFPPPDRWLAGYSVNYYYLGYTLFALLGRMAQVAPRLGYNLANITIFALGCTAAYSLAVALTKDRRWGPAGTFSVMIAGNLQGLGQVLAQFKQGARPTGISLWCSTRVIGGGCNSYTAITEFPIFSVIWNDLHPHLMTLPFALLAITLAVQALLEPLSLQADPGIAVLRWVVTVIALGALFPLNSWDYPTYAAVVVAATLLGLARRDALTIRAVLASLAVVPSSLLAFTPYYLTVHNETALGIQANATPLNQVLAVIGSLLIPAAFLLLWQGWSALHDRASRTSGLHAAQWLVPALVLLVLLVAPPRTDLLYLLLLALGAVVLVRHTRSAEPEMLIVVILASTAVLVLLTGDFMYIRDPSDHSPSYRLNTLFKLYYQAWLLLGVVAPYAVLRIWQELARRQWRLPFRLWATSTIVLALGLATYPIEGVASQARSLAAEPGLDGLLYVRATDPPEYAAITWVLDHTRPAAVIAEGYGSQYWGKGTVLSPNELTTLTGRQSILAWPDGHETLWRAGFGLSPAAVAVRRMLEQRAMDLTTLYLSPSIAVAQQIIRRYHIAYVFIGPYEWQMFVADPAVERTGFAKFRRFLRTVLSVPGPTPRGGVTIYAVPPALDPSAG
jgi:YYY domain-containing protein